MELPKHYPTSIDSLHKWAGRPNPTSHKKNHVNDAFCNTNVWHKICHGHHIHQTSDAQKLGTRWLHQHLHKKLVDEVCKCFTHPTTYIQNEKLLCKMVHMRLKRVFQLLTEWMDDVRLYASIVLYDKQAQTTSMDERNTDVFTARREPEHIRKSQRPSTDATDAKDAMGSGGLPFALRVHSSSAPNVSYDVNVLECTCTCPDFVYRRKADTHSTCKHLRHAFASLYYLAYQNDQLVTSDDGFVWLPQVEQID